MVSYNTPRFALPFGMYCYTSIQPTIEPGHHDPRGSSSPPVPCVDTVITQGPGGVDALDKVLREGLQYEPGSTLYMGVQYAMLRMEVRKSCITHKFIVYMPEHMVLYVQPVPGSASLLHVRVERFLVTPCDRVGGDSRGKRKVQNTQVGYDSDESDTTEPGAKGYHCVNHTSEKVLSTPHVNNTLRQRIK